MSYQPPSGPPYPGYPPPMPPQRPSAFAAAVANFKRMPPVVRVLVAIVAVLVVCACIGVAASAGKSNNTASATATSAPQTQATHAPSATSAPKATATPAGPQILTGATLGGLQAAFQAKYGSPIDNGSGTAKAYHFSQGIVTATPAGDTSSDGKTHIASLRIGPASGSWDEATATPICAQFLPPDAQFVNEQQVSGYGQERVYTSASLALSLPADDFNGAAPGTFAMELGPNFPFNKGCIIILGQ